MFNSKVSDFFKNIKKYREDIDDNFEIPSIILPSLRSYQRKAVKWMNACEKDDKMVTSKGLKFSGGILADEMGLGKTVEMLSCIMANRAPREFYNKNIIINDSKNELNSVTNPTPSTSKYISYSSKMNLDEKMKNCSRSMLNNWYNNILNEMSTVSSKKTIENVAAFDENSHIIECYCVKTPQKTTLVYCIKCGKGQHAECVHFEPKPFQEVPYLCANCWIVNDKLQCKATLIVVPQSILNQWVDEIEKHIAKPGLNIMVYNGVHSDGYIQPFTFNNYDIILVSYNSLARDLNYVGDFDCENRNTRLRHSKKYYYPKSPLPCLKWWRICLDEGQAVENINCKVFEMTSCLESVNKWVMTGTPIQKSLNDLFGILKFLDISPYCDRKQFNQLMTGDPDYMYSWFSKLLWRNTVEDVNSELNIPKITYEQHMLTFSQIEKHFYLSQHDACTNDFLNLTMRLFTDLDIPFKEIDKRKVFRIVTPLYKLRQACVHPQAVNGQFLKIKGIMTMEKLMDVMIEKCSIECNDILRSFISQHNALAGLYIIRKEPLKAVEHYNSVLGLIEKYKDKKIKVDPCQKIHVMYNLASVLEEHKLGIDIIPYNLDLKKDMEHLEKEYLDASKQNIETTRKTVTFYSVKIRNQIGDEPIGNSKWWSGISNWFFSPQDFLNKVRAELEEYRIPGVPSIGHRLKCIDDVANMLDVWSADLNTARTETISILKTLEETPMNDLVISALTCHLRLKSKRPSIRKKCLSCKAENQLQTYESLLFCVSNKQKNMLIDSSEETDNETLFESSSKGYWKMSQKEFLLTKLFQYVQAKIINETRLKDAAEHIKILELVRKEFRYLRLLWTHLSDGLSAHDEIVMAKSRLRLGDSLKQEPEEEKPPKRKKAKNNVENDVIMEQFVDYHILTLNSEISVFGSDLDKKMGTLLYLENIKKENSSEMEPCPICCFNSDSGWAVLQCGHSLCNQCLTTMCNHSRDPLDIICPMCRSTTPIENVSNVQSSRENVDATGITIKGSFSTKIENITLKLMELITEDPFVKVIIFSSWDKALNLLGEALLQNSVNYRILKNGNKYKRTIQDFKTNENINALLMKVSLGSKGLNLTEATRIFFMEPLINKSDELQAIGRIYRIGQTKPTFVHHFITKQSIEENIMKIFSSLQLDNWDDITLSQLMGVFERTDPNRFII